jgi:hypothetical protein
MTSVLLFTLNKENFKIAVRKENLSCIYSIDWFSDNTRINQKCKESVMNSFITIH